ncbi:dihydrodipicolinate synthase family protein [Niabella ginsengisoli]|uniref:Dihydrodipicolinate synthase family protein n=1 Tax=Niabella ginsengisoli TaxID=522298 RepID=A0ABS9SN82_9BACT|nr:dihydrodipicolinate synthase family protein [Niabella ginsengisoli]MCH5599835.1 dihydrodipicolinate synthase family protein [Niabella ginsengisoli]
MTPLNNNTCRGNWGTLLLPINADESIDFSRLSTQIDLLIAAGVDGIYSNGTAGEFHTQTEIEFDQINQILAEKCNAANMPFQIGVSHLVPAITLDRITRTKFLEPSAYQVILPDWVALTDVEAEQFFIKLAEVADTVPLVLYNPPHAKRVLSAASYANLFKKIPSLISVKLLDGDDKWYNEMKPLATRAAIFVPGHHLATGVHQGVAQGAYSNVACINPKAAQQWWQLINDDIDEALKVEAAIQSFFTAYIVPYAKAGYSNPALDKLLATTGNWAPIGTRLRWPYQWISEDDVSAVRKGAEHYLPAWFFQPIQ